MRSSQGEPLLDAYDVVVVGSGIGGLVAASLLARAGLKVLVAEAQSAPGGYAHAFERGGYVFDPAVHLVVDPPLWDRLLRHLGVRERVRFLQPDDFYSVALPGFGLHCPFREDAFVAAHVERFPNEAESIRRFFQVCGQVHREAHELPARIPLRDLDETAQRFATLFKYRKATLAEVLDEHVPEPRARAVCGAASLYLGLPPSLLSFQTFAQMIFSHVTHGANYCAGGLQTLVDALVAALEKHGGALTTGNQVERIVVRDGVATGVILQSGQQIQAGAVISNADPIRTFETLVGVEQVPTAYVRAYRRLKPSISSFIVFAGTPLDVSQFDVGHLSFCHTSWDAEATYRNTLEGRPEGLTLSVPTLVDPSLAPAGHHELILGTFVNYDIGRPWAEAKENHALGLLRSMDRLFPGLGENLSFTESSTPQALERFTLNHRGAIYGWENLPEQVGSKRPDQQTPIQDLYLAGHWTAPGGGFIRAALSGMRAAQLVLDQAATGYEIPRFMS